MTHEQERLYYIEHSKTHRDKKRRIARERLASVGGSHPKYHLATKDMIEKVVSIVCDYFGITKDFLLTDSRKRPVVEPRQIAIFLLYDNVGVTLKRIGAYFGDKDHTTILHSRTTVENLMFTNKFYKEGVLSMQREIEKITGTVQTTEQTQPS